MIVTQNAKQALREALLRKTNDKGVGLRLIKKSPEELVLMLDCEAEGDQVIEHQGLRVLLIAQEVAEFAEGLTLDVQETNKGKKLILTE